MSIINNISSQPGASIPRQNMSWYGTKATYTFLSNKEITTQKINEAISSYANNKLSGLDQVLIIHDITNVSFPGLESTSGLGYTDDPDGNGFMCLSALAVSDQGQPLSLVSQHTWIRDPEQKGKAKIKKMVPFESKESFEWKRSIDAVNSILGSAPVKIHIADRQSDIYELFLSDGGQGSELLLRAHVNRKLMCGDFLWPSIGEGQPQGTITLSIPEVKGGKKKTSVQAAVTYQKVAIKKPVLSKADFESVTLTAIEVKQIGKLKGQDKAIDWKLLTTMDVRQTEDVLCYVRWYSYRWLIERFHYVLKSGTRLEDLQLKEASSLQKALHLYGMAAFRVMLLVYDSRHDPNASCELVLATEQWQTLYVLVHKDGSIPNHPPSLEQAVKWIGRLGGHLGRNSDGPPGLKTVWLGYQRLCDAAIIFSNMKKNLGKA